MAGRIASVACLYLSVAFTVAEWNITPSLALALSACNNISEQVTGASSVVYGLQPGYDYDINHWFQSSTQNAACVLEVGQAMDVATALEILGHAKVPFAVKSGGHASNPGFSSTPGVQISFQRFNQVLLANDKKTVEIGMGQNWSSVYQLLQGSGINVVGGRVAGPGVGGFTLGGGYSWKTNQYGLTCDSVKSYNLVLPNGTVTQVSAANKDLFFALKGGLNRFGIVTSAEYYTHPQVPLIYGGLEIYGSSSVNGIIEATNNFNAKNTDPKAQVIVTLAGSSTGNNLLVLYFYDGPKKPAVFDSFFQNKAEFSDVKQQSFSSFVSAIPSTIVEATNVRGRFSSLNTKNLTPKFLAAVQNQSAYYGSQMPLHGGNTVNYDIEPFLKNYGQYATSSGYPHSDSPLPLNIYFAWDSATHDTYWLQAIHDSHNVLRSVAKAEGILSTTSASYPNYAMADTPITDMYGSENAAKLHSIRKAIDPENVMGLAGGFDI